MSFSQKQNKVDRYEPNTAVDVAHRKGWRAFMKDQIALPPGNMQWAEGCEALQRTAQGWQATFGSAFAHMMAVPHAHRFDPREAPNGFLIFTDDPHDSNPFGHVVGKWGDSNVLEEIPTVTNDVNGAGTYVPGEVSVQKLGYFPLHWGDAIRFATDWCGDAQIIPQHETQASQEEAERDVAAEVRVAIRNQKAVVEAMDRAIKDNDGKIHPNMEQALKDERNRAIHEVFRLKQLLP